MLVSAKDIYTNLPRSYVFFCFDCTFTDEVNRIIDYVLNDDGKGDAYKELALLTDLYGHRLSGTQELEDAIGMLIIEHRIQR